MAQAAVEQLIARGISEEEFKLAKAKYISDVARRSGSKSFLSFVKQAWEYVPSCEPLEWGWHMDALCWHYEWVARGQIPKLVINCPPGHAKSVLMSVLWPAWIWTWWPQCQMLFASYSAGFATRDSVRCRDVLRSSWYREQFMRPGGWQLKADENNKTYYVNTAGGDRIALGIGGAGRRAHIIGIDEPIDQVDSHSKSVRDTTCDWIGQTISQRFVNAKHPRIAMIQQRFHEMDPSGWALSSGEWEHLRLPSEFVEKERCITHRTVVDMKTRERVKVEAWKDPRKKEGELLFPTRFPQDVLDRMKKPDSLGEIGFQAQHQQKPVPAGGIIFQPTWWRFWKPDGQSAESKFPRPKGCNDLPARPLPQRFHNVIMTIDANFRDKATADPVSLQVIAEYKADVFVLYRVGGPFGFTKTLEAIRTAITVMKKSMIRIGAIYIEARANGDAIIDTLTSEIAGIVGVEPFGGKEARAWAIQPYVQAGNVYLPEGAPWLEEYVAQFSAFPRGAHDDDVDAFSQGLNNLTHRERETAEEWAGRS